MNAEEPASRCSAETAAVRPIPSDLSPKGWRRLGGDTMGFEMDLASRVKNAVAVRLTLRNLRSTSRGVAGRMNGWRFFAILLGIGATIALILSVAVYYGYVTASWAGNLTYGEWGVVAFLLAAAAVGCEVASRER